MDKRLTIAGSLALFLAVGLWNALRPGTASALPAATVQSRLDSFPRTLGDWSGEDFPIGERILATARADAYLNRRYTAGSQSVNVLILYGEAGDTAAHDPKVCYGGNGFTMLAKSPRRVEADDFQAARFERALPEPAAFEVWWGWGVGKAWSAPDMPRLAFARESRIFKVYFQQPSAAPGTPSAGSPPLDRFLPLFLAEWRKTATP